MSRTARNRSILMCGICALFFGWPGIAGAVQDVNPKDREPSTNISTGAGMPSEEAKDASQYIYDPTGKTDPFKSFIAEPEELEEKRTRKPKTYLETLDLSQLELIAIIVGSKGNFAMVRDSKGIGHVIKAGTLIGTNNGVVTGITEREVTIREEYRDFRGRIKYKDVAKKLPSLQ